jgi:septal ring factor EnvC (AmiA/AmiB activator)
MNRPNDTVQDGDTPARVVKAIAQLNGRQWTLPQKIGIPATLVGVVLLFIGGFLRDDVLGKVSDTNKRIDGIEQRQNERDREASKDKERIIRLEGATDSLTRSVERIEVGIDRLNVKVDEMRKDMRKAAP